MEAPGLSSLKPSSHASSLPITGGLSACHPGAVPVPLTFHGPWWTCLLSAELTVSVLLHVSERVPEDNQPLILL